MIYLDSCVPIYAAINPGSRGRWSRAMITSIENGDESAITSTLTLDEFTYKVREVEGAEASVEAGRILLDLPNLRMVPVDYEVLWRSLELVEKLGLYPRDSIHAATVLIQNISTIVSEDKDFDVVPKIERRWMD